MAKEEAIRVSATVKEALPNAVFRVELDNGAVLLLLILKLYTKT